MVIELLIMLLVGLLLVILGLLLWKKQKISLLHDYHYQNVRQEDIQAYTKRMGIGLLVIGACTVCTGLIDFFSHTQTGWLLFAAGFVAGLVIFVRAQKRYNGGVFS